MSCKKKAEYQSKLATTESSDPCNLAVMKEKSDNASKGAFQCSYDALKTAGKLATGTILADVAEAVTTAVEFKNDVQELLTFVQLIDEWITSYAQQGSGVGAATSAATEDKSITAGGVYEKTNDVVSDVVGISKGNKSALFECFNKNRVMINDFYSVAKLGMSIGTKELSAETLTNIVSLGQKFVAGIGHIFEAAGRCSEALNGKRDIDFNKALKSWEKMTTKIGSVAVIAKCGVSLGQGGYILAQNTMCLAGDLVTLMEGFEQTERMQEDYVQNTVAPMNTDRDDLHCMKKYGIYLQSLHSYFDFKSTAFTCAEYCGNNGKGLTYMSQHFNEIFPSEGDRIMCKNVPTQAQPSEAIKWCLNSCCYNDSHCGDKGWNFITTRGL